MDHDLDHRFQYHPPSGPAVADTHTRVRQAAATFAHAMDALLPDGREKSLVMTKAEEAIVLGQRGGGPRAAHRAVTILRWIRGLRRALDDDRRRWPPLDPGPHPAVILGQRAGDAELTPLSTGQAAELAEDDTATYGFTPPEPGLVDRSGLSIDPW